MAYITKRGNSYSVRYTYEDEHGKSCDKWEIFLQKRRQRTERSRSNMNWQLEHS